MSADVTRARISPPQLNRLSVIALICLLAWAPGQAAADKSDKKPAGFWVSVSEVIDGDTFWAAEIKYRVIDIDAPETSIDRRHGYKCDAERRLGELAKAEAEVLLLNRKIWIQPSGKIDRYGRPLVRVRFARGRWFGDHMIEARLAARWQGRKHNWCG